MFDMHDFRNINWHRLFFSACACFLFSSCGMVVRPLQSGDLLVVDDFDAERLAWKTWQQPGQSSASYLREGFVLVLESPHMDVITTNGINLENVSIEVIAEKMAGSDDNHYGVVCRFRDNSNYYGFSVTSDGYAGIYRVLNGTYQMLSSTEMQYSEVIHQGDKVNVLRAVCDGDRLVLYANQEELASALDDALSSGQTGLIAGTFADPELAVKFDNFIVTVP